MSTVPHTAWSEDRCASTELETRVSYRVGKRALDLCLGVLILPILVPILCCIAIAVRLASSGPVFFGHARHRNRETLFTVWKFRTMYEDSATVLQNHLDSNPDAKQEWTIFHKLKNDPRVTPVGRFLRRTSLDELPQIWNVLLGNMSFVGPRPITTVEIDRYGDDFVSYCRVKPGITGLWQTSGRNSMTYQERVQLDATYARDWSLGMDLHILLRTFRAVLEGNGAY